VGHDAAVGLDAAGIIAGRAAALPRRRGAVVVAVTGPVAVGKSTLAHAVADAVAASGTRAEVVGTDGFLLPNAVLATRGLAMRKGFPESYETEALRGFLGAVRAGAPGVTVPVYSHETYDVVADDRRAVAAHGVVIVEGVNALSATVGLVDLGVYVDAPETLVEAWYVERFVALCASAGPESFYARFAGLDRGEIEAVAREVHRTINLENWRTHIEPTRALADVVVEKGAGHAVERVEEPGRR
jgi:type I pantothenate kinase